MSLELSLEQIHLASYRVGYNRAKDTITFLPFAHDVNERVSLLKVCAYPITSCDTIEEMSLRRNGHMAGVRIRHVRDILQMRKKGKESQPLTIHELLELAEEYMESIAPAGFDLNPSRRELARIREKLKYEKLLVPQAVLELIAA